MLGHVTSGRGVIPPEQKIVRLKHSPGSGVLSVSVVSDGPTRILRITDENKKVFILIFLIRTIFLLLLLFTSQ